MVKSPKLIGASCSDFPTILGVRFENKVNDHLPCIATNVKPSIQLCAQSAEIDIGFVSI